LESRIHDEPREPEGDRRATQVLLHQRHRLRWLEIEPAGIEADAFADQRHAQGILRAPAQIDQPWRFAARAPHGMDRRETALDQLRANRSAAAMRPCPSGTTRSCSRSPR